MNSEELRETLVDLNRARELERRHRMVSEGVLEGLRIISQSANTHEAFNQLLTVLKELIGYDHAFVLREGSDGLFSCAATTDKSLETTRWNPGKLFKRILSGQPVVMFDVAQCEEWVVQPECIRQLAVSALHAPLITPGSNAILICVSEQKAFFHKDHQALLQRFAPLACQALNNLETSQKLIEETAKLKEAQATLQQLDQLKNEFISTAAHELRTPVTSIMGYTELLSEGAGTDTFSPDQQEDFRKEIINNSMRLVKVIDDILDVSRIESGQRIPLDMRQEPLESLLAKTVERFRLKGGQQINLRVSPTLPETLRIDAQRITQVIDNLVSNAIKYSPNCSSITLSADRIGPQCLISVADRGIGMSPEQLERIFEKFYRADSSNTAVAGLGLGMSIVKQIVEDHGGDIFVESEQYQGTIVSFTLPL